MLNNIQIYHIKAEDPMINNTSIGKQMHIGKEDKHGDTQGKCVVGLVFSVFKKKKRKKTMAYFGFFESKRWRSLKN